MVGAFPGINDYRKRAIRAPTNPLDKTTVVSLFPREIDEIKHTIQPGRFLIPAGSLEKPGILVVGSSSWWKEIDQDQPLLEIPVSSIQIGESIVRDYCNGILGCNMGDTMPGLFYVPGEWSLNDIKTKSKALIEAANTKQRNWYQVLIRLADTLWARTNGNPLTISEDMRLAARELNLINKEWIKDTQAVELIRCIACGHLKNPLYPVCSNCKAISDPAKAKELGLVFAQ